MIKNLVIHLGDTKTGSTALQSVLRSGEYKTPHGQTVYYPGTSLNQNRLPNALSKGKGPKRQARAFSVLADELRQSDADYGVVSAELFQAVDPKDLKRVIDDQMPDFVDRMRLISYVRPHAEKFVSTYSEQAKFGKISGDLRGHLKNMQKKGRLDFTKRFTAWRNTFGDRFSLRLFQRDHLLNGDVVEDFFAWMLGAPGTDIQAEQMSNSALTAGQIALLRRFYDLMPKEGLSRRKDRMPPAVARALVAQFRATGLGAGTDRVTIPPKLAQSIQKRYKPDAAALDAAFFQGTPMSDALGSIPEKLVGTNKDFEARRYFSDEALQAFDTMAKMSILLMGENKKQLRRRATQVRVQTKLER